MPKYKIKFPARCTRFYRHLAGDRRGHCPLPLGHEGPHHFPPRSVRWERRHRKWQRRMDRIRENAKILAAELQEYVDHTYD